MKTRDRILTTALDMFNHEGVPKVSTNHIADEMDISPGNLYYHFKNKDEIIDELFGQFRKQMEDLLLAPTERAISIEELWIYLHLIFETISRYRFLYRNLVDLTQRSRSLRIHFNHILRQKLEAAQAVLNSLREAEVLEGTDDEIEAAAVNIALLTSYWLSFATIRSGEYEDDLDLGPAVYQVLCTIAPLLREPERSHVKLVATHYL